MKSAIINARIIDTKNNIDETGGILINEKGLIESCGKKVTKDNIGDAKVYDCANKLAIEPEYCLVFEDSIAGVQAAKTANMSSVGVGFPADIVVADKHVDTLLNIKI